MIQKASLTVVNMAQHSDYGLSLVHCIDTPYRFPEADVAHS